MIIYKATDVTNSKVYVGMTTTSLKKRKQQHLYTTRSSGTTFFSKAISEHGRDSFIFEQIDEAANLEELILKEKYWIGELNTLHPNGYNYLNGLVVGSELARNRCVKVFCKELNIVFNSMNEASRELSLDATSIWYCCQGRMNKAGGLSFEYADVEKKEKAKKTTELRKIKNKESFTIMGIRERKGVLCLTTGQEFSSIKEASEVLGIDASQIVRVCKKKDKQAKGMVFEYIIKKE